MLHFKFGLNLILDSFVVCRVVCSDRPILIFFITDTDTNYLHVYVPDNRYAEPIFIYCYKVNK